jgi:hypothetical protein
MAKKKMTSIRVDADVWTALEAKAQRLTDSGGGHNFTVASLIDIALERIAKEADEETKLGVAEFLLEITAIRSLAEFIGYLHLPRNKWPPGPVIFDREVVEAARELGFSLPTKSITLQDYVETLSAAAEEDARRGRLSREQRAAEELEAAARSTVREPARKRSKRK